MDTKRKRKYVRSGKFVGVFGKYHKKGIRRSKVMYFLDDGYGDIFKFSNKQDLLSHDNNYDDQSSCVRSGCC